MTLVVTGSFGIDTIETPDGQRREDVLGGSCAYFAAAASFFTPVRIVGVAGEDYPAAHLATLKKFGIDTRGLELRKGGKTFRWSGKYLENMDHRETTSISLNVLGGDPAKVPPEYKDSEFVFLANGPTAIQRQFLKEFAHRKLVVADTMDLWINTTKDELLALLKEIDGLVLNYDEAELLTGLKNTVAAAQHILALGPKFVVVKKGEHGCVFAHKDGIGALPAYPAEKVVDPTGAGDSFAGGKMGWLAANHAAHGSKTGVSFHDLKRALAHGTVVASFTIEAFSLDRLSKLSRREVDERYLKYASMLHLKDEE
jgi:sugar/nucleoside kinase (ribokinase family)